LEGVEVKEDTRAKARQYQGSLDLISRAKTQRRKGAKFFFFFLSVLASWREFRKLSGEVRLALPAQAIQFGGEE
jgi:hypothetical protein